MHYGIEPSGGGPRLLSWLEAGRQTIAGWSEVSQLAAPGLSEVYQSLAAGWSEPGTRHRSNAQTR